MCILVVSSEIIHIQIYCCQLLEVHHESFQFVIRLFGLRMFPCILFDSTFCSYVHKCPKVRGEKVIKKFPC